MAEPFRSRRPALRFAAGAANVVMVVALVVLVGWFTHTTALMQVVPNLAPMQRNTAACFFLMGLAMLGASTGRRQDWIVVAAGFCTGVASLTLFEYVSHRDLGIDQILGPAYVTVMTSSPGRMAPTTAICFILAAAGLMLGARPLSKRAGLLLAMLGSIVAAVGVASWMGFALGSNDAFGWGVLTRLALLTALSFSVLGLGMVALAWSADVQTPGTPDWLPVSLAIGVSTFGVGFWQALIATERSKSALLPGFALVGGFVMAGVVALAVFLAQRAYRVALALTEANRRLEDRAVQLSASEQRLAVQYAATRVLAESGRLADAMPSVLGALCTNIGWQMAELWQVSREAQTLARVAHWHEPDAAVATSALMTGAVTVPLGAGLPGHVAETGAPHWLPDIDEDPTFQRTETARAVGIRSAFAVPVGAGDNTIGVMTFFSTTRRERSEAMLEMVTAIGSQVGQFIERRRLEDEVARDVTERKRADAVLQETQLEQIRLKDGFLSHVSHELRSPLTAVYGLVTTIAHELAAQWNPDQQEYMRIIVKNIRHLEAMIDDLLEVTRAETGKLSIEPQSLSLHDAVGDALETLRSAATAKDIALSSNVPERMPQAYADPSRMQQILTNLINNAVKFTPVHGSVQVDARVREADPTLLVIEVSDTGCGISPADTDRIFERLYQVGETGHANRTGLGLGLDICKQLVEGQGGQIWVTSEVLKGSTFSFTVPVATRAVLSAV